jgi:predicted alpha/beta-hydrolase family hydrolase
MSSLYTRLKITLGSANADEYALAALQSDHKATVAPGKNIVFTPEGQQPTTGVILYPGGRCDARAYAPVMKPLADSGCLVVIPQMPLRLAVLDTHRADTIMAAYPSIQRWIIGGHSMGGAMAAAYVFKHPELAGDRVKGLFFLASYPSGMHAMPDSALPMTLIYGTHDMITRKSEFDASRQRLPKHTIYTAIEGGDHYQFGSFGNVDITATITRAEQQRQVIQALLQFVDRCL